MKLLAGCILALCSLVLTQTPTVWAPYPGVLTGTFEPIVGGVAASSPVSTAKELRTYKVTANYTVNIYNVSYGSAFANTPKIVLGIVSMEFKVAAAIQAYQNWISATLTYYQHELAYPAPPATLRVAEVKTSFLAYNPTVATFLSSAYTGTTFTTINTGSGLRNQSHTTNFGGKTINLAHSNALIIWIAGFSISGGSYDLTIATSILTSTSYNITFSTKGTTQVSQVSTNHLLFDITKVQATQTVFFDMGSIVAADSVQTVWPSMVQHIPTNYFVGIKSFGFVGGTPATQFDVQLTAPFNFMSSSGYVSLDYEYINIRERVCTAPDTYYYQTTQLCYSLCPLHTFVNPTYNFCGACHYSCDSCINPTATDCTVCDVVNAFRSLSISQCDCNSGYYDNGIAVCQACHYSCLTCGSAGSTSCLTCGPTRAFSSGSCACVSGLNEVGTVACSACDPSCASCEAGGVCITCFSPNFFPNGLLCTSCHGSCATCFGPSLKNCLTCNPPASLANFQCQTCPNSILRTSCLDPSNPLTVAFLVCITLAGLLFVVGLYYGSIIPVELAHLLQMVFFAVSLVSAPPDPLVPAAQLSEFVNGYIYRSGDALASPPQIHAMNFSFSVFQNCNVMIIVEFLIAFVGICLLRLCSSESVAPEDIQDPVPQSNKSKAAKFLVYSLLLDWALFTNLGISFAFGLYVRLVDLERNALADSIGSVAVILVGSLVQARICYNVIKGKLNQQKRKSLKSGTESGYKQAPYHPAILAIHRMLLGLLMGLLYDVSYRAVVILMLQLAYALFSCIRNPFRERRMIARQLLIEFTILLAIVVVMIYEYSPAASSTFAWVWVEWGVVMVCIIWSIYCFVQERIAKTSAVQPSGQSTIQHTEGNMAAELGNTSGMGQTSMVGGPMFESKANLSVTTQVVFFDTVQERMSAAGNLIWLKSAGTLQAETTMEQFETKPVSGNYPQNQ